MARVTGLDLLRKYSAKVPTKVAAQYLGGTEMFIRCGLRENYLPIGSCQKITKEYAYHISPFKLVSYQEGEARLQRYIEILENEEKTIDK